MVISMIAAYHMSEFCVYRSNLTSFGVPNITALNQTVLLVFQDLTITNPESYTGTQASCNCDIRVEVLYTPLRREIQNQVTQIDVDLVYGSIQEMVTKNRR